MVPPRNDNRARRSQADKVSLRSDIIKAPVTVDRDNITGRRHDRVGNEAWPEGEQATTPQGVLTQAVQNQKEALDSR